MIPVNINMGAKQKTIRISPEPGLDIVSVDRCFGDPLKIIQTGNGTPAKKKQ